MRRTPCFRILAHFMAGIEVGLNQLWRRVIIDCARSPIHAGRGNSNIPDLEHFTTVPLIKVVTRGLDGSSNRSKNRVARFRPMNHFLVVDADSNKVFHELPCCSSPHISG
jgi:hypothetical protein